MAVNKMELMAKIEAPIVWGADLKFKIQDLQESQYDEVLRLIKHHYFTEEPMCKSIQLRKDHESVETYLNLVHTWMQDTLSVVAVSQQTGRAVGAAILCFNTLSTRNDTYNRVQILKGDALNEIRKFMSALILKTNFYEELNSDLYLGVNILVVHPSYRKYGVSRALLDVCNYIALYTKIPQICGIFTSNEHQVIAENLGFSLLNEIPYNNWLFEDEVVFDDPGVGNYSAEFMYLNTPDEETLENTKKEEEKEKQLLIKKLKQKQALKESQKKAKKN